MATFKGFSIHDVPEEGKLPDGDYNFRIKTAKKLLSQKVPGKETAIINLTVLDGKFAGQEVPIFADYRNPGTDERERSSLHRGLKTLRAIVSAIQLEGFDVPEDLIGGRFTANVKNNGDFMNLSKHRPIAGSTVGAVKGAVGSEAATGSTGRFATRTKTVTIEVPEDEIGEDDIPL